TTRRSPTSRPAARFPREIGVSRRQLERKFAREIGRSPLAELQRLRLGEARRLLLETRLPLRTIAFRSGVGDANKLVSLFRKETGQTPGQFRKQG
ncbi:MAG: helix-turn-helix domain-containing protein, partial [Verrucomicrobiales bacterium]|nr:helix-turn-helix domain-containing protein [Verrucomicrobiales bacterium]